MKFETKPKIVDMDFIRRIQKIPSPHNAISEFTFYRTYSRFDENLNRRESWLEAVVRACEYSVELGIKQLKKSGLYIHEKHYPMFIKEAEELIEEHYLLKTFVSGRTLYTGGTLAAEKYPLSNFNCSSAVIDEFKKIGEIFYLLMVGTGTGFRILKSDVEKLPNIRQNLEIVHDEYNGKLPIDRLEETVLMINDNDNTAYLEIGDSKEGWRDALDLFFELISLDKYKHITKLNINYNSVRPKGEKLKVFGGTASGHTSIKNMFITIDKIINNKLDERLEPIKDGKLRPIHVMDILNAVAYNVVSGGVRRSAQICLFSPDDLEVLFAKYGLNGLWGQESKDNYEYLVNKGYNIPKIEWETNEEGFVFYPKRNNLEHRRMSNNTALFFTKPSRELLHLIVRLLETEGEPGFFNMEEALRRFPWCKGTNPCVEILLDDRGLCNLSTIPVINHVKNGILDKKSLFHAAKLSARIGVRMTTIDLELPEWDEKQKQHRLTGCSLTGWQDMIEATGMTEEEEIKLQQELREITHKESFAYAAFLRVPAPNNVTAIKPEGTQSILAGAVSPGLHFSHSEYHYRRIRITSEDALCKAVESMNWPVDNEVGQGITYIDQNTGLEVTTEVTTKVITFPIKSPAKKTKYDVSAKEQFDIYFKFQKNYTDQNTSNTITVKNGEWEEVEEILWNRWDEMLAVSFLSLDNHTYELAPYETIDKETYEKAVSKMPKFNPEILELFETNEEFDIGNDSCDNGSCPIR